MALKIRISEKCERCGARNARRIGDQIIERHGRCPNGPPGPPVPPRTFKADAVVFVPCDFDPEFLRKELEEAWVMIDELRNKRWLAKRAVADAVTQAMRETYKAAG
jgi:hypothetical protein